MVAQVEASGNLLFALQGRPHFEKVSTAEAARLKSIVVAAKLTIVDMSDVAAAISKVPFVQSDRGVLLDAIAEMAVGGRLHADPPPAKIARTSTQNYEAFLSYLPDSIWSSMEQGSVNDLFDFLIRLGLRCPSEPTSQLMSLCILHESDGMEKVMAMSEDCKLDFCKAMKASFKRRAKFLGVHQYLDVLPDLPSACAAEFPDLYSSAFGAQAPGTMKITQIDLQRLRSSSRMRVVRGASSMALGVKSFSKCSLPPEFMLFGQNLIHTVQSLANDVAELRGKQPKISYLTPRQHDTRVIAPYVQQHTPARESQGSGEPSLPTSPLPAQPVVKKSVDEAAKLIEQAITKPGAKAKAKSQSKSAAPNAKPKGKSPCKAKGEAKAKPSMPAASGRAGCSKCRYSHRGCARCR